VQLPPLFEHVLIYFLEKKQSQQAADAFFQYFQKAHWVNSVGTKIKNWKTAAWYWIYYQKCF
jgi:hypothetical protein